MRSRSVSWRFNKGKKNLLLTKWKTWKTGVNLIIHFNFPLSFGQHVKENERVCRDGTKAKGVISRGTLQVSFIISVTRKFLLSPTSKIKITHFSCSE